MAGSQQRTRRKAVTRNDASAITVLPDVSGEDGMVDVLHGLLDQSSRRRKQFEAIRVANGHELDDPVAGLPATREDGTVNSYRLHLQELDEQERRLGVQWPDEVEMVRRRVADREKAKRDAAAA